MKNLTSNVWKKAAECMRKCHAGLVGPEDMVLEEWPQAFRLLVTAIREEKAVDPEFSPELSQLTEATGFSYEFSDILEEYFDFMELQEEWDEVIASCDEIMELFAWKTERPSEYKFRKGNALMMSGRLDEAEVFGKEWLAEYPDDYYAAASNVFLLVARRKYDEAEALTEKYLGDDLVCDKATDTLFMAAYRLYEITDNLYARQRIEKKMAECNILAADIK